MKLSLSPTHIHWPRTSFDAVEAQTVGVSQFRRSQPAIGPDGTIYIRTSAEKIRAFKGGVNPAPTSPP